VKFFTEAFWKVFNFAIENSVNAVKTSVICFMCVGTVVAINILEFDLMNFEEKM
jgi:hypothetical protein